jgi:hypothetical protein
VGVKGWDWIDAFAAVVASLNVGWALGGAWPVDAWAHGIMVGFLLGGLVWRPHVTHLRRRVAKGEP